MPDVQLPATFGKYELLERIATGGMAEVYLARAFGIAGFEKRLVIKRIRPELAGDPHHISLFINEARIGVQLSHENVVQVYDLGKVGRDWYIAMEHLHGRDLNRVVKVLRVDNQRLPVAVAVYIVAEICRGLGYAHALHDANGSPLGLVHRDVSPHNVLLTFGGGVKLVDFGIARLVGSRAPSPAEQPPGAGPPRPGGGKYAYMSPEQARGEDVDHRTDLFSAGIVLWELLVGHRLYQHDDPTEKLRLVQNAVIPNPADEGISIDDGLKAILARALAQRREDRYVAAALFEEDLRAWLYEHAAIDPRKDLIGLLEQCFPEQAEQRSLGRGLEGLLADMERLGAGDASITGTPGTSPSHSPKPDALHTIAEERKRVVALFVDVDGLTELSKTLEPEELFRRRYRMLRWLRAIVDRYRGHVQRVVDDQVLVLFGVPKTRSDDLVRAVECALELRRSIKDLLEHGLALSVAIGLHAGEVTVDLSRKQPRYVARGDTTRLARRLSAFADHDQILMTQRVMDGTHTRVRWRPGPAVPQRGGKEPTSTYLIEGRRHALRVAGRGAWLRRGPELDVIRVALARLQDGVGSVLILTGDVGSGKSRLTREVRDLALKRGVSVKLGNARAWGEHPPLEILRDLVLDLLSIESDAPIVKLREGARRLHSMGLTAGHVQALQSLMRAEPSSVATGSPIQAIEALIRLSCAHEPVIVILEDLHHLDPQERAEIATLVERLDDSPVVFLLTSTGGIPEDLPDKAQVVALDRFHRDQTIRLLRALLEVDDIDDATIDFIDQRCEGNPLYVEEMAKYLVAEGHLVVQDRRAALVSAPSATALPESLASLIAARIDALQPASKGALQLGAVLGPTFSVPILAAAMGLDAPESIIEELSSHGLVLPQDDESGAVWGFASELVREAALRSTLGVQRRTYHRLVAEAMEHLYANDLSPHLETLATHCAAGGRHIDAARYLHQAGSRLVDMHRIDRAKILFDRGLRILQDVPDTPENWEAKVQGEAMLSYRSGAIARMSGEDRDAERSLRVALDISSDAGLPWVEARVHLELGRLYLARAKFDLAEAHLAQASRLADLDEDDALLQECVEAEAHLASERGREDEADALWERALQAAGTDHKARARCLLGLSSRVIRQRDLARAASLLDKALGEARASGDRVLIGRALNNQGLLRYWAGSHDEALEAFREALQIREGMGNTIGVVINQHHIGDVHLSKGDLARAWVAFDKSRDLAQRMGWRHGVVLNEIYLGHIEAQRNGCERALPRLERAIDEAYTLGDTAVVTNGVRLGAQMLLDDGQRDRAIRWLNAAIQRAGSEAPDIVEDLEGVLAGVEPSGP